MVANESVETKAFVVVGVDFGTTFTGVAYADSSDPDHKSVVVINSWPGSGRENRPKVPTELSYHDSGVIRWGWQLAPGVARYGGFKLLLDPTAGRKAYNDEQLALTLDPGNPSMSSSLRPNSSATDMATDYLRLVYAEVMDKLAKRFPTTFQTAKIKFVITTPAMWSPAAQHNTLQAAKAAGFGSRPQDIIEPVTEPEAAASYALREINTYASQGQDTTTDGSSNWQCGKQVIICDAGGGTVDLVSYAIDQVTPYLSVSETTPPRGGLCGATSLDQRFLDLLRRRLGSQAHFLDGNNSGRGSRLMVSFDNVKRNFGTNDFEDDELIEHTIKRVGPDGRVVRLDRDPENGIDDLFITLSHQDMKSIFDPVVEKILALVESMLKDAREKEPSKPVVGVILVGGFGESVYLFKRLKSWAEAQSPPLFVGNPKDSWAAIAKGAVSFGLEGIVHRRILPCHYGVNIDEAYNAAIHDSAYNYEHPWDNSTYNKDTMTWFAKMGEAIDHERRITVPFALSSDTRYMTCTVELRTCRYGEPPTSRRDARALKGPSITIDVGSLPNSAFREKEVGTGFLGLGSRRKVFMSQFTLEMVTGSASLRFEIRSEGVLLASQKVDSGFVGTAE